MSSAGPGDPDRVETPAWKDFKNAWENSSAVRRLNDVLAERIGLAHNGVDNDQLEAIAAPTLGSLAAPQPRCIHETTHDGPGYRAEWQHWVAAHLQTLKRQGRARFDRGTRLWFPPMSEQVHFVPGEAYVRRAIHDRFGGQEQGGISTPTSVPVIFLFTGAEGQAYGYDDGPLEDGSFRYFGEGQVGDMTLTRGNLAIKNHAEEGRDLHLFRSRPDGKVTYVGQMVCAGVEMLPSVPDRSGNPRLGIAFRLVPLEEVEEGRTSGGKDQPESRSLENDPFWKMSMPELKALTEEPPETTSGPSKGSRNIFRRSASVKVYVQRRADGKCEGCDNPAPFKTPTGRPYLEPHHTRRLSDGGPDHPGWVVALCPTCHRRAHYAEDHTSYNAMLQERANQFEGIGSGD